MSNGCLKNRTPLFSGDDFERIARSVAGLARALGIPSPVHIGNGIFAVVATISPEAAQEILDNHHIDNNRNRKRSAIASYAMDLKTGSWSLTHQGIAFNQQGLLFDGQNRLYSSIEADAPITTIVFFNVPDPAMPNVDNGVKRSMRDATRILGNQETAQWASIIRHIAYGPTTARLSNSTIISLGEIFDDAVRWVQEQFPSHIVRITTGPVLGAIGRAYYHVPAERLAQFCCVLRESVCSNDKTDKAAATLLKYLNSTNGHGQTMSSERYQKTETAIRAFEYRQPITKLYGAACELYPLPSAIAAKAAVFLGD